MLYKVDTRGWEANTAWCVPTAVSFLSGIPLIHSHSRAAFIQNKKLKEVQGVYASESLLMLREQGMKGEQIQLADKYSDAPTLRRFLDNRTSYEKCMPLMIQIEDKKNFCHMISAHFGYAADNHTMKPVPIDKFPHLKKLVTGAWIISKL
jgi:hypothetical protein